MTGRRATSFGTHARTHAHGEREGGGEGEREPRERGWTVTQGVVEALACAARALSVPQ